jgi:hypothetical protein
VAGRPQREKRFQEWIFLNASSVLLSEKTGELLTLNRAELDLEMEDVRRGLEDLSGRWGFAYAILRERADMIQFILYQADRLQAVLEEAPHCVMVGSLHYPESLSAEGFIEEVRRRWEERGCIPHEIGIALGYPLDDVFGFMGLLPLPCKGVCGWRVYGCLQESNRRSCAYMNARCRALAFLAMTAPKSA